MMLLEPAAAVIAGAVAMPILAVLYLLKLRRRPVRVSSTLLWRESYRDLEANIPWRWVRPSWLFLLHAVLVGLVVLAIGRPAIGGTVSSSTVMVIVLDCSASMNALDGQGGSSRFDEARRRALRVVDESMRTGRGVRAGVIAVASTAEAVAPLTTDRRRVRSAIESVQPTDQPLDLDAAMELAGAMLGGVGDPTDESQAARPHPLLLVFSDGSFSGAGARTPPGVDARLERVGPSPTREPQGADPESPRGMDNAGIVALSARRDMANPALVRVFAEIHNAAGRERPVVVSLSFDGVERERRAVEIPPASGEASGVLPVTFDVLTREEGVLGVELIGRDLLAADDRAWLAVAAPRPPRILVVVPDPASTGADPAEPDADPSAWVIESILRELGPESLRVIPESSASGTVRSAGGMYDVIVFDRVTPAEVPPVSSIVLGGGLPALGVGAPGRGGDSGDRDAVLSWDRSHPLLRDVTLDAVYALPGSDLADLGGPPVGATRTDLAHGASGPLISLVETGSVRHVAVGFGLDRSNWGLQIGFTMFLANAVDFLSLGPDDQAGAGRRTADAIEVVVPAWVGAVAIEGPERREVSVPTAGTSFDGRRRVSVGRAARVGVYTVSPGEASPRVVAVNLLDARETSLRTSDDPLSRSGARRDGGASKAGPGREIAPHLLAAVLVLLVVEWLVFSRSARGA